MTPNTLSAYTRGGTPWIPTYVESIDPRRCIGCGRCFKVCSRAVLALVEREASESLEEDDDWDDDAETTALMTVRDPMDCIGCGACGRTCPKGCFTFSTP
ncbi:ferredoxin III, nif-specific [Thermochromatium tepidum]|uniref:Ferredoxin III n=1 Tax=Thermochromatium tepidum ATCC 43061 TaxID=316276 RepID=A0A6I6E948_THETI|nr:ferredoxin III, nif-specific [Thermochromatium tepidum]QGU33193.1 ferredoxin III, nif-specific [Thermochromatium tepidum ATCC 43061]